MPRPRLHRSVAAFERRLPVHAQRQTIEHRLNGRILHQRAGCLRTAFAQHVLAPELDRIELERPRHHVGVALVGPDQLRNAESAQRARRRQIGVERIAVDAHILDVVRPGCGETRLLRDAGADIGIGAAVPVHVAGARGDAPVLHPALDAERRGMLGECVELLFHGQRDFHRPLHQQRERRYQCFHLDVELGAEAAAEMRHLHPHLVLRPAEQARDLDPHERRRSATRYGWSAHRRGLADRDERLQRQMQNLLGAERMLEH